MISFALAFSLTSGPTVNLEEHPQEFVLETKRIVIPQHPFAFNPSIIRWQGKILMSFRVLPGNKKSFNSEIGLVWLNEQFEPEGDPYLLSFRDPDSTVPSRAEDGRLIQVGSHLYLVYSDCVDLKISKKGFRVNVAELLFDGSQFYTVNREPLTMFEGETEFHREKNWVPFDYQGELFLSYSIEPHVVFHPLLNGSGICETISSSVGKIAWSLGRVCGGTPAIIVDGEYLSFFHSWINMSSLHSDGNASSHYFMGAYTFSLHPPFEVTRISTEPIVGKGFYEGEKYPYYWKPVQAIFPCGIIVDGPYIWVAYGRQDRETWVTKLDKKMLLESLQPMR